MTEKPLHVRVAEALGDIPGQALGYRRYDTDWSATGPLIERLGIAIERRSGNIPAFQWVAAECICADHDHNLSDPFGHGEGALIAVCNLILALHEAGKVTPTPLQNSGAIAGAGRIALSGAGARESSK